MILLTGLTGLTGSYISNFLSENKLQARALVRNLSSSSYLKELGFELVVGNLEDEYSIINAMTGVKKCFLLTSNNENQVQQDINFIEAALKSGVEHIIKYSATGADSGSESKILQWKAITENILIQSGIKYTIIRPNLFMQNFFLFSESIKHKAEFHYPLKDAKCGFVDLADISRVIFCTLTQEGHENQIYTLTGPDVLTCHEVAEIFSTYLHKKVDYINISESNFKSYLSHQGVNDFMAEEFTILYNLISHGLYKKKTEDIFKTTQNQPNSFENFVKDNIAKFI